MSEKSLFFNALPDQSSQTGYDRNYNADDISDHFAVIWENGVIKETLQVLASTGLTINVAAGKAAIKGKAYTNDTLKPFTLATAPTGTTPRYDYVVLKYDNNISVRDIHLEVRSTTSVPSVSDLVRTTNVYELMLGYITVMPNAQTITQANITDTRGNSSLCPWFTAVKGYADYYDAIIQKYSDTVTVESQTLSVTTGLAASLYNSMSDLASVYINGALVDKNDYTLSTVSGFIVITFDYNILAGQEVTIISERAIDGEGLPTALAQYNALVAQIAALSGNDEFNYECNGVNDNVLLSTLASTFLNGGTDYARKTIRVNGTFGMTAANQGAGTSASPYQIFNLGLTTTTNRRITFDFSNCTPIRPTLANSKYYTVFSGYNVEIKGAVVSLVDPTSVIVMFDSMSGVVNAENCRFVIVGVSMSYISRTGTFTNCYSDVSNMTGNSYAYWLNNDSLVRLNGGEHYAYATGSNVNGVVYFTVGLNCAFLSGANFPTVSRTGFIQTNYLYIPAGAGVCAGIGIITTLASSIANSSSNRITSTLPFNKPNML